MAKVGKQAPQKRHSTFSKRSTIKKKQPALVVATKSGDRNAVQWKALDYQAAWLTDAFRSALESLPQLEHNSIPEDSLVHLSEQRDRGAVNLSWHAKNMFGTSWKDALFKGENSSNNQKGSPSLLILCSSATRCVELLKGLKDLSKECKPAKLFAKHIKVEEQVKALEGYVNIAAGTPNRVKKLMDVGAFGLGRLSVVVLDMHEDAKGMTLFTVPQVKTDFWELYRDHFQHQVLNRKLRICLY